MDTKTAQERIGSLADKRGPLPLDHFESDSIHCLSPTGSRSDLLDELEVVRCHLKDFFRTLDRKDENWKGLKYSPNFLTMKWNSDKEVIEHALAELRKFTFENSPVQ